VSTHPSLALGAYFLAINGFSYKMLNLYTQKMELLVLDIADNKISKDELKLYLINILSKTT
jgi:hypothetical protein